MGKKDFVKYPKEILKALNMITLEDEELLKRLK